MRVEQQVKERPILFSGPMVTAILEERKTQTRRVMKPQPEHFKSGHWHFEQRGNGGYVSEQTLRCVLPIHCPYGQSGDRLWVRETWWGTIGHTVPENKEQRFVAYRATMNSDRSPAADGKWRPSIFMPRWASRITLEITGVRVERVQEISEADKEAEGCNWNHGYGPAAFEELWNSINAARGYGWDVNPWCWVLEFKKV